MPRKTDMADYSEGDIDDLMWAINSTPRKCLGYQKPAEAFLENLTIALKCESSGYQDQSSKTRKYNKRHNPWLEQCQVVACPRRANI